MRRRELLLLLGSAMAATAPLAAQQKAMSVIGCLGAGSSGPTFEAALMKGLSETGYDEGRNLAIEWRWAEGQYDRLPVLAGELVRRKVGVIIAVGGISARAAKGATATIPIVFMGVGDPV